MSETLRDINEKNDDEDKTWSASQSMLIHWSCILKHTLGFIIWNSQIYALEMGLSETHLLEGFTHNEKKLLFPSICF